ncbi:MAG: hypothetical protein ABEH38_05360, partial [Flavobacteriales bacterium]
YIFHGRGSFGIGERFSLRPGTMLTFKGKQKEVLFGTLLRYPLKSNSKYTGLVSGTAVSAGAHLRMGDALIVNAMLEMGSFALGLSYDINISELTVASKGKGGLELSLRFISPNPFKKEGGSPRFL